MECVASEYVLDFELERPMFAKNLKIFFTDKCKFFLQIYLWLQQ